VTPFGMTKLPDDDLAISPGRHAPAPPAVAQTAERRQGPSLALAPGGAPGQDDLDIPLVVDLDGTLVFSDLSIESVFTLAKRRPLELLKLPLWLAQGRAQLKHHLAAEVRPDARTLPYNRELIAHLEAEKHRRRSLILATGSDEAIAGDVARELGLFDAVLASDGSTNLAGKVKRDRLVAEFGAGGFDYAADSHRDRSIWAAARKAVLVGPIARKTRDDMGAPEVDRAFGAGRPGPGVYFHALRVDHWSKNLLVFLPLLAAHQIYDARSLAHGLIAFIAFSLCASSVYLLNDLLDLPHDRLHPHKRNRALASGRLPIGLAVGLMPLLWLGAFLIGLTQPPAFLAVLGIYCLLMLAYSLRLRELIVVDVMALAAGYALRVAGGAAAASLPLSPSLLAFCLLFFFGLALVKRYAELVVMHSVDGAEARARAYVVDHRGLIEFVGCASGYLSVGVLAFDFGLDHRLDSRFGLIWLIFPLLIYWITHIWRMAHRGHIVHDPVAFALTDRPTQIVVAVVATIVLIAT
jgi:4-hydroxybenzoate polyprenyltransferase